MKRNIGFLSLFLLLAALCALVSARTGQAEMTLSQDGRFIIYDDGTVFDRKTELMWAAKDNGSNLNWFQAKTFTENFRGGGFADWRMPTVAELETLYDGRRSQSVDCGGAPVHVVDPVRLTCRYVWSSERQGNEFAFFFFDRGYARFYPMSWDGLRVLPVRLGGKR
jgi:hypothetical protein